MGLFKPGWMGTNPKRAKKSLQEISDETALMEIIKNAPLLDIRLAAIDKIHSREKLLALSYRNAPYPPAVKTHALSAYFCQLSFPKDETCLVDKLLKNRDIDESGAAVRKKAARMLPKDHALLDRPCCPKCGCVDAVVDYVHLRHSPIGYDGFSCTACGKSVDVKHENVALRGYPAPRDFSVSLQEFSR